LLNGRREKRATMKGRKRAKGEKTPNEKEVAVKGYALAPAGKVGELREGKKRFSSGKRGKGEGGSLTMQINPTASKKKEDRQSGRGKTSFTRRRERGENAIN